MAQQTTILDIGSSKVICLVCGIDNSDNIIVHGAGIQEYLGYRRGEFADEQHLRDAVASAVEMAEMEARCRIRDVAVGVPAPFTRLELVPVTIQIESKNGRITEADIEKLLDKSAEYEPPEGFEIIHSTPVEFTVDTIPRLDVPVGASAKELGATISHVYIESRFKSIMTEALIRLDIKASLYIGLPLSEGLFVIPEQDRKEIAILLDVGYSHTDISVIHNTALVKKASIDVGGMHITNDLAYGLKLPKTMAENVKRRYVYSLDYQDSIDNIRVPGGGVIRIEHEVIQFIIESRTRELAALINDAIESMGIKLSNQIPVYLTGGGIALMRGSCEYLEHQLGVEIRIRMPWMPRLSSPNYASAFSVMNFVVNMENEGSGRMHGNVLRNQFLKKILNFFVK